MPHGLHRGHLTAFSLSKHSMHCIMFFWAPLSIHSEAKGTAAAQNLICIREGGCAMKVVPFRGWYLRSLQHGVGKNSQKETFARIRTRKRLRVRAISFRGNCATLHWVLLSFSPLKSNIACQISYVRLTPNALARASKPDDCQDVFSVHPLAQKDCLLQDLSIPCVVCRYRQGERPGSLGCFWM